MREYKISDKEDNYAVILPEKGATVISFMSKGIEVFYRDIENVNSSERPRCGIPFLFPVFGRTPEDSIYPMEIHGFGHTSKWNVLSYSDKELRLELAANEETRKVYPFEFRVELIFTLQDGKLNVHQRYENRDEKEMPFSFGFHPYFAGNPTAFSVKIDAELEMDMATGQPKLFDNRQVQIVFPEGVSESGAFFVQAKNKTILYREDGKQIHMQFDQNFNRLVFWAVNGKDFLCVEPINSSPNGLVTGDCYVLAPGETREADISIQLI